MEKANHLGACLFELQTALLPIVSFSYPDQMLRTGRTGSIISLALKNYGEILVMPNGSFGL